MTTSGFGQDWLLGAVPSPEAARRHLADIEKALTAVYSNLRPHPDDIVWPYGLNRRILPILDVRVRTYNCVANAHQLEGCSALKAKHLLRLSNFGRKSLEDLLFAIESFLKKCILREYRKPNHSPTRGGPPSGFEAVMSVPPPKAEWENAGHVLNPLLATAAELLGFKTLIHVLGPEIRDLAHRMGVDHELAAISIDQVTGRSIGLVSTALARVTHTIEQISERDRMVVEHRLLRDPPATFAAIGDHLGVSAERVRQLQLKVEKEIRFAILENLKIMTSVLKDRLGHLAEEAVVEAQFDDLLSGRQGLAPTLIRRAIIYQMGYKLNNGAYCDGRALQILNQTRAEAGRLADDVGLVNQEKLISSLPDEKWRDMWPWVRERCQLIELFGSLVIRDNPKVRAKAALLLIGRPATCQEIARVCGNTVRTTGAQLRFIPSIVKVDKDRWSLDEWIDDEYQKIVEEIIRRIHEDGGATTVKRLLAELPTKYGVKTKSVQRYMSTPKFVIKDGWVSLATKSSIGLRPLEEVIDGRDSETGVPYWTFRAEARHFGGYSVGNVPPEIARALGCSPDSRSRVQIENLPSCPALSIRWRLASTRGASLGCVAEALKRLELEPGERVRVAIRGHCCVALTADGCNSPRAQGAKKRSRRG